MLLGQYKKIMTFTLASILLVPVSASANGHINSMQAELSEYCGIDVSNINKDIITVKDGFIHDIKIKNDECQIEIIHAGNTQADTGKISISSQDFIAMLAEVEDRNDGLTTDNDGYNESLRRDGIIYLLKDYIESSQEEKTRLTKLFHKRFSSDLKLRKNTVKMVPYLDQDGRASSQYVVTKHDAFIPD